MVQHHLCIKFETGNECNVLELVDFETELAAKTIGLILLIFLFVSRLLKD